MRDKGSRAAHEDEEESPHGRGLLRQGQEEGRSPERPEDHDEERQPRHPGHVPPMRREGLPDRRLTFARPRRNGRAPATGGGLAMPDRAGWPLSERPAARGVARTLWYDGGDARSGWTRAHDAAPFRYPRPL